MELYSKLVQLGITDDLSLKEKSRIKYFNTALLFVLIGLILSLLTNIITKSWNIADTIIYFGGTSVIITGIYCQSIGKTYISRIVITLGGIVVFFGFGVFNGNLFVNALLNLMLLMLIFIFFEDYKTILSVACFQLAVFIIEIIVINRIDYPFDNYRWDPNSRIVVFSICFGFVFAISRYLRKLLDNYMLINEELVKSLEEKNEQISSSYADLESYAYMITHDIKTPVNTINGFIQLAKKALEKNDVEAVKEYLSIVDSSGTKLDKMISDILTYSKLYSAQENELEEVKTSDIIDDLKEELLLSYPTSQIKHTDLPKVNVNSTSFKIVFQNLLDNALKYNDKKIPKVEIDYNLIDEHHIFRIKDNGIGIHDRNKHKIFNLFTRLHSEDKYSGTGLGLANCKKLVQENLKGTISVESELGQGSIFTVALPI